MTTSEGCHSLAAAILVSVLLFSFGRAAEKPDLWLLPPVDDWSMEEGDNITDLGAVSAPEDDGLVAEGEPLSLEPEELTWYDWLLPSAWEVPPGWNGSVEVGVDGSEGNARTLTFRSGANIKRKIDWSDLKIAISYVKATAEWVETKHNAQLDINHDWLLGESPWSIYGKTIVVYDEFRPFRLELTFSSGLGYRLIDNDSTTLKGRIGSGATRQFRGLDNNWVPEGLLGVDFEHQFSAR